MTVEERIAALGARISYFEPRAGDSDSAIFKEAMAVIHELCSERDRWRRLHDDVLRDLGVAQGEAAYWRGQTAAARQREGA